MARRAGTYTAAIMLQVDVMRLRDIEEALTQERFARDVHREESYRGHVEGIGYRA